MLIIKQSVIEFLDNLSYNNNREWFIANKEKYLQARTNFEDFVQALIDRLALYEHPLRGLEAKSCIFRINRDIRFSNDKSPYKTNFGALIIKGGRKNIHRYAGYYLHIEPSQSMISGGAYIPDNQWLTAIRERIDQEPENFVEIITNKNFKQFFGTIEGEKLKSAPKGYDSNHPYLELLKYKSFMADRTFTDKEVTSPAFFDTAFNGFLAMKPLNDFLNNCLVDE